MKRRGIFFFILPLLVLSGAYYGISQDLEPEEPEIVLPSIILEIEDLSIESVTAALPEEEELLAPEFRFPLPETGELEVAEPQMDFTIPETGASVYQVKEGKYLTAEAVLGTGTSNQFYSRISLYFLGEKPEGKILYQHETVDGFSSKSPGSGYNMREDRVKSFLNFNLWDIDLRTEGAFNDRERGLQGNGGFYSKINRFIDAGLEGEYRLNDRFILKGSFEASSANQLLTEGITGTEEVTEYCISPSSNRIFLKKRSRSMIITAATTERNIIIHIITPPCSKISTIFISLKVYMNFHAQCKTGIYIGIPVIKFTVRIPVKTRFVK